MIKPLEALALAALLGAGLAPAAAQEPSAPDLSAPDLSAQDVVNRSSTAAYYQGADGRARVSMVIADAQGRERQRELVILRTDLDDEDNGEQHFYVSFNRPADVSRTAFLVWKHVDRDDDRWLYLPALDLVRRIAASDERTSFVGSHFFYEDISGRGVAEDEHALAEATDVYHVVDSTPKDPDAVEFARYRSYIHKETFIPVQIQYFDAAGEVYRTYTASRVESVDGWPTVVEARMADQRMGGATTLTYSDIAYDVDLPEDVFTERALRTPPRRLLR